MSNEIIFTINEVLNEKNISKNWLEENANLQRSQLNSYANNKVKRIDLDVLARICIALNVEVGDLIKLQRNKGEL
ncbi:transcriptional regulator [Anaerococcus sp. HMSC075B03]|nr:MULTISPECIES: helix-turn-helix transcriptional regulator [Peptoniphilaceae]MDK7721709.1 helix-turn-helix transcriptional regulator [Peptoniphilus lacrimalis]MDK7731311.1 helix-turn-helix transcriptional regulator [Peptoniphilus lacrimalis]OFO40302.1 transcriptional regulator [Anaerococcus sp. HMSC075B03]QQB61564.1 helix-turn-helix transcriptional regulator [Anaerococcus vaginalis]QQN56230.1 helix-turn-helix transcriptional regulator [Anaerococcus obesiensis]